MAGSLFPQRRLTYLFESLPRLKKVDLGLVPLVPLRHRYHQVANNAVLWTSLDAQGVETLMERCFSSPPRVKRTARKIGGLQTTEDPHTDIRTQDLRTEDRVDPPPPHVGRVEGENRRN